MTTPYTITILPDQTPQRSFDQRFYHAREPLLRGDAEYFCQYGQEPDTFGFDKLTAAGATLAAILCDTLGIRQFVIHTYHVGALKGAAFDWPEVEYKIVAAMLFVTMGRRRFEAGLRYHADIVQGRLTTWHPIGRHYLLLCREAGIEPALLSSPELRVIDLDSPPVTDGLEITSEQRPESS